MWSVLNPRELLTCFDSGTYTLCVTSSRILVLRRHVPKAFPVIIPLRPHSCVLCVPPYLFHSTAHSFFNQNFDWSHARCHQSYQLVNQIYLLYIGRKTYSAFFSCELFAFDSPKGARFNIEVPDWTKLKFPQIRR